MSNACSVAEPWAKEQEGKWAEGECKFRGRES